MKPVKKPFKIGIIVTCAALAALAGAFAAVYYFFPIEKVKTIVAKQAEASLARAVSIGHIRYGIHGLHLSDITVFDGLSEKDPTLAKISECHLGIHLRSLLSFQMNFDFIHLEGLSLDIVYANGISNLERFIDDYNKTPITTKIDVVRFRDARISLKNPPESMKPLSGTYRLSSTIDISSKDATTARNTIIHLPENRGTIQSERIDIAAKDGGFLLKTNVALERCSLLWVYGWKSGAPLPFRTFDGTIDDLIITAREIKGKVKGSSQLASGKTIAVDGACTVTIPTKHTLITNTECRLGNSSANVKVLSIPSNGSIDRLVIQKLTADIQDIQPLIGFLPTHVRGTVSGNFSYENGVVNADIKISGGAIGIDGKIARNINETIQITNNTFRKENIAVTILDTPCTLSIATAGNMFNSFIINASAKEMTIDTDSSKDDKINLAEIAIPIAIQGNIAIEKLFIDKYTFSSAKAAYAAKGTHIAINSFSAKCFGGEIEGRGAVIGTKNDADIETTFTFKKIKVQQIAELHETIKNRFFGTAHGKSEIAFRSGKDSEALKSMKGRIEFTIDNGKLVDTGLQNGLGTVLSEMKYKLKDLEFSKIAANLSILGSNFYVNHFEFFAPDVRLKLEGYFNKELEGDLKLNLEFNKNFIQDVPNPALLQLNKYKQGGWYIIPFAMKGSITKGENYKKLK